MKKSLLLSVVAMFAATGFAQNAPYTMDVKVKNPLQNSLKLYSASDMEAQVSKVSKAPARSIISGTYFTFSFTTNSFVLFSLHFIINTCN